MECRTCEAIKSLKAWNRELNADRKARGLKPRRNKLTAAVVDRTFSGRSTFYSTGRGRRIPLNFCPECGQCLRKWEN